MIPNNYKTSIRVPSQLPEFVRDDLNYETFVSFVQAYYEWMELANTSNSLITTVSTTDQGVTLGTKNLTNYFDVDTTIDGFIDYFIRDFLPYFPEGALSDKTKILKIAKQLYTSKGTPASYDLLFRLLYNSPASILETKDLVFRASDGAWYIPKLLKVKSDSENWLLSGVQHLRVFGETSKTFANIEGTFLNGNKYDVYISDVERLYISGELVRVVDIRGQDVLAYNGEIVIANNFGEYNYNGLVIDINTPGASNISGKLVGAVSSISIDPKHRGSTYNVGDPVVVYGGLNSITGIGAKAQVYDTTTGSINSLGVTLGGYGYRKGTANNISVSNYPNTSINFIPATGGAISHVENFVDNDPTISANVILLPINRISIKENVDLGNTNYHFTGVSSSNVNSRLLDVFSFDQFETYPISSVVVDNGGAGYSKIPDISATSNYYDIETGGVHDLSQMGILAPLKLETGGLGYSANDRIIIDGGRGFGASANVKTVDVNGTITSIQMVPYDHPDAIYPLGGQGYKIEDITGTSLAPLSVSVSSSIQTNTLTGTFDYLETIYQGDDLDNATFAAVVTGYDSVNNKLKVYNIQGELLAGVLLTGDSSGATINVTSSIIIGTDAIVSPTGILGEGASFTTTTDRIGSVTSILVTDNGEDYIATPNVSLRVQDLCVTGIQDYVSFNSIAPGTRIFQGQDVDIEGEQLDVDYAPYQGIIDSIELLVAGDNEANSIYNLRVYNYYGTPRLYSELDPANTIIQVDTEINPYPTMNLTNALDGTYSVIGGVENYWGSLNGTYTDGVKSYGDGNARATAKFLNGLIYGQGQYLDTKGQPSAYSLIQSSTINDFTYELSVEVPISQYRDTLKSLLHPAGMNVVGRELLNNQKSFHITKQSALANNLPLYYFAPDANVSIVTNFVNTSNNIVTLQGISSETLANTIVAGQRLGIYRQDGGMPLYNKVSSVDYANTKLQLYTSVHLTYSNVASGYANASSNVINITSVGNTYTMLMGGWDLGGYYSTDAANNQNILIDMVFPGDHILMNNITYLVSSVNYANNALDANAITQITLANNVSGAVGSQSSPKTISINRNIVNENNVIIYTIN